VVVLFDVGTAGCAMMMMMLLGPRRRTDADADAWLSQAAQELAKKFYLDIEELDVAADRKDAASATASYEKAVADLNAFKSAI
jgi:hypothetical protein